MERKGRVRTFAKANLFFANQPPLSAEREATASGYEG